MPRVEPTLLAAHIRRIAAPETEALTDAELVGRYVEHRDAAAFEVLVWRHGPMVWATSRRILRHQHDLEDAFQATFLALARNAKSIGTRQAVAGWLHRVATNAALKLKAGRRPAGLTEEVPTHPGPDTGELAGAVDEELNCLPERMRAAFVLCCLEGMTSGEAARELGCPVGTIDSRLHAARVQLRDRLTRRGFGPAALAGIVVIAPPATSMATAIGAGAGVAPSPAVDELASQMSRIMTKGVMTMKTVTAAVLAVAFTGAVWAFGGSGEVLTSTPKAAPPGVPGAQPPVGLVAARPQQPGGILGHELGTYLTIEGVKAEGTKIEINTLLVDTVNGKKLDKPVPIAVRFCGFNATRFDIETNLVMPLSVRYVCKGFESGGMIGVPQAVSAAAKELGRTDVPMSPTAWQWRTHFVALIEVKPEAAAPKK